MNCDIRWCAEWKMFRFARDLSDVQKEVFTRKCEKWADQEILRQYCSSNSETGRLIKIGGPNPLT
jgi:hypothetical protein